MIDVEATFLVVRDGNGYMLAARCCPGWHLPISGTAAAVDAACERHAEESHGYAGPELYVFRRHPTLTPTVTVEREASA